MALEQFATDLLDNFF